MLHVLLNLTISALMLILGASYDLRERAVPAWLVGSLLLLSLLAAFWLPLFNLICAVLFLAGFTLLRNIFNLDIGSADLIFLFILMLWAGPWMSSLVIGVALCIAYGWRLSGKTEIPFLAALSLGAVTLLAVGYVLSTL